jgi:RND family efflux transporter MFP subunit
MSAITPESTPQRTSPARWMTFYSILCGGTLALGAFLVGSVLKAPTSRLYSSSIGYPALARWLGNPIPVNVSEVTTRSFKQRMAADGMISYLNPVQVRSEVVGIVSEVLVQPGQRVQQGDVLLRLNTGGRGLRLAELERQLRTFELEVSRLRLAREEGLAERNSSSPAALEVAQHEVRQAELAMQRAQEHYESQVRTRSAEMAGAQSTQASVVDDASVVPIVATVDGTIFDCRISAGHHIVRPEEPLLAMGDQMVFVAQFDQRHAGAIRVGDEAQVYLRAHAGRPFRAVVSQLGHFVATTQSPASALSRDLPYTFRVWLELREDSLAESPTLLMGMNGYCMFEHPFESLAVPERSLLRFSGKQGTVLVVDDDGRLQVRQVTYKLTGDGWVAISSGLAEGERVVLDGQLALREGDQVEARSATSAAPVVPQASFLEQASG